MQKRKIQSSYCMSAHIKTHPVIQATDINETIAQMSVYKFPPGSEVPQQELNHDLTCLDNWIN